jgi:HAD superfamily hydrolase (TIGR01509 family)
MKRFRGVLLDVDGTLVDSNEAHARSWVAALAEEGIHVSVNEVRKLIGMGGDKLLPHVSGIREDTPQGKKISKRHREIFLQRYLPRLQPTRGARELLWFLHDHGFQMVVATSARDDELKGLLKICGADRVIESKTSSEDVDQSKPDPDLVAAALKKIGLPADEVVMLGDTPYDIEAAQRAGVAVIAFRCGGWGEADLHGALAVYEDPEDLLTHLDTSPLAAGMEEMVGARS